MVAGDPAGAQGCAGGFQVGAGEVRDGLASVRGIAFAGFAG
ncbi:MAG TPA: hypothetical protein VGK51_11650 [Actinomycetota bacterium]